MAYIIDGPVTVGDTGTSSIIKGNISVPDTSSHTGDIFYTTNTSGAVAALQHTPAGVLLSDFASALPVWLANGTTGQVLTATTGANPSWITPSSEVGSYGFSANYSNSTTQTTTAQTSTSAGTITQAGFIVTGVSTVFTDAMIGGQLVYGGNTFNVTGFSSATSISVFPAATQASAVSYTLTWGPPLVLTGWDTTVAPFYDGTSGGFVSSTGIFTNPNATGKYILECQVTYTDSSNAGYRLLQVLRNANVVLQTIVQGNSTLSIPRTISVVGALKLTTSDTIKIQFVNNSAGTSTIMAAPAANGTAVTHWDMVLQATS